MTDEMLIVEMRQLKEDSIQINKSIVELRNSIESFKNKYQTQRMLGEVVKPGLDEPLLHQIENQIYGLRQMQELFDLFPQFSEHIIENLTNPIDESLAKEFR